MAAKPIKISVLADVKDLQAGLGKAEAAMDDTARSAGKASDKIDKAFSTTGEASDKLATASAQTAGGLGDLGGALALLPGPLAGVGSAMETAAPAIMGVTGAADLLNVATEKFPILAKVATVATNAMATAKRALGVAIRFALGPIGLIIAAIALIVGAIVLLYKKNETFRNFVNAAWARIKTAIAAVFTWMQKHIPPVWEKVRAAAARVADFLLNTVWPKVRRFVENSRARFEQIREKVQGVVNGVRANFDRMVGFIGGLPGRISSKVRGMFDGIKNAFRSAINYVIDGWNGISFRLPSIDTKIPGVGRVGGFTLSTPNIPRLAEGGVTTGPMLAWIGDNAGGREAVIPLDKYDLGGNTYNLNVAVAPLANPVEVGRQVVKAIEAYEQTGGRRRAS